MAINIRRIVMCDACSCPFLKADGSLLIICDNSYGPNEELLSISGWIKLIYPHEPEAHVCPKCIREGAEILIRAAKDKGKENTNDARPQEET